MIQAQIKLRPTPRQVATFEEWLFSLTGVWNWAVKKIENDAADGIYHSPNAFQNLLANHGRKIGIPSHTLQGMLKVAHVSWSRCFKRIAKKPRLKGVRNKLNSIPFPDPIRAPKNNYIKLPGIGAVRFHKQSIPDGKIKNGRIVRRASGWYLCLFVDAERASIARAGKGVVGIDPGFRHLATLSTGEKIDHPRELKESLKRLGQAQRGHDKKLTARLHERVANQRKDRNHKISLRLVQENVFIAFSKDNIKGIAKKFGKSVSDSGHAQIRSMLKYKSRSGGTEYVEPDSKNSTRACSACGGLNGPTGLAGLSVRRWVCPCGAEHDRDINAAINTLIAGAGTAHEEGCNVL